MIIEERAYDGRTRLRCTEHNRVAYRTLARAERAAATINASGRTVSTFYAYAGRGCGTWHLSGPGSYQRARRERAARFPYGKPYLGTTPPPWELARANRAAARLLEDVRRS